MKYETDSRAWSQDGASIFVTRHALSRATLRLGLNRDAASKLLRITLVGQPRFGIPPASFIEPERWHIYDEQTDHRGKKARKQADRGVFMYLNDIFWETGENEHLKDSQIVLITDMTRYPYIILVTIWPYIKTVAPAWQRAV
jgi:hypothetical protein